MPVFIGWIVGLTDYRPNSSAMICQSSSCGLVDHVIDDAFVEFRRSGQLDLGGLKPFGLLLRGFGATADQTTFQFFEGTAAQ